MDTQTANFLPSIAGGATINKFGDYEMRALRKLICFTGLLALVSAIPVMAQIDNPVTFEAPFAFYAGNAKLPAGNYSVTQPEDADDLLLIRSADGSHSVFVEVEPVSSATPARKTEVTFKKYGDSEFISSVSVQGEDLRMRAVASKVEKNAAKTGVASTHALSAKSGS